MTKALIRHIALIGIGLYLLALVVISIAFSEHALQLKWVLWGIGEVLVFFVPTALCYPRWKNAEDKENNIENAPKISIKYSQSADTITWKACAHADNDANDYAFLPDDFSISKVIRNSAYDISLYGKPQRTELNGIPLGEKVVQDGIPNAVS